MTSLVVLCFAAAGAAGADTAGDIVLGDFEGDDYGGWTAEGTAFGEAPARGTLRGQMTVKGYVGEGLANSYRGGDPSTGRLRSPRFTIERDYLSFLIGGGDFPGETCLNLVVDGNVVASATGENSETLTHRAFDLRARKREQAVVEVVDSSSGGWGHVTVDHVMLTNDPIMESTQEAQWRIDKRYLNIPLLMGKDAPQRRMYIRIDGDLLGEFDAPLAVDQAHWYGFIDLSQHQGKRLAIEVTRFSRDLSGITLDDSIKASDDLYDERYRPQLHFSTKRGWLNDPNGLIYYQGTYHLYYQYNPLGVYWGNMSWGHAVSDDMVHWEEQPAVLYPLPEIGMCYSGAAFIDEKNQLGLKAGPGDVLVAFYLRTKIGLCYAYSTDGGQTMTDYAGNPVLNHPADEEKPPDARMDTPRPFWFEPTQRWITPTFDYFAREDGKLLHCVGIYSSEDLKHWTYESRVEQDTWGDEMCSCVDFFQLPIDGDPDNQRWIMVFIDGSYIVGNFDGHTFCTLDGNPATVQDRIRPHITAGNYFATMTWHNMPDHRRVQLTFMARWGENHGMPFSQQMTLPSELTLHSTPEGPRLRMNPIDELSALRGRTHEWTDLDLGARRDVLSELQGDLYEIELELVPGTDSETVLYLRGVRIGYDAATETLSCNDIETPLKPENGRITLRIYLDRASVEIYANEGRVYTPLIHRMPAENRRYSIAATRGHAKARVLRFHELKSIWKTR